MYIESFNIKVGLYDGKGAGRFFAEQLLPTSLSRSKILDTEEFIREFKRALASHYGENLPKLPIFFILDPEATELFLLTSNKQIADTEQEAELMEKQIRERLGDENPEDFYVGEYKIAPFTYQFVGVKKSTLDSLLEVGRLMGLEIGGVFPLGLLLAKTNTDISSMFVIPKENKTIVVFSELTGVSLARDLDDQLPLEELRKLFWELSVYNKKPSDLRIYSFPQCEQKFTTSDEVGLVGESLEKNFEEISMARGLFENGQVVPTDPCNLINMIPKPTLAEKRKTPAATALGALSVVLVIGLLLQLTIGFNTILDSKTNRQNHEVLSSDQQQSQTQTVATQDELNQNQGQDRQDQDVIIPKEVKRSELTVKVENGNGIPGSAGKLKTYLEGFGYKVLEPGNADRINYAKTIIKLPKEMADYKNLLVNDLKTNYSVEIEELDIKPSNYDVLVIVGRE